MDDALLTMSWALYQSESCQERDDGSKVLIEERVRGQKRGKFKKQNKTPLSNKEC